jgi:hypothetical protein
MKDAHLHDQMFSSVRSSRVFILIPASIPGRGSTGLVRRNLAELTHSLRVVAMVRALE